MHPALVKGAAKGLAIAAKFAVKEACVYFEPDPQKKSQMRLSWSNASRAHANPIANAIDRAIDNLLK